MRVLVCGSRDYPSREYLQSYLDSLEGDIDVVIQGGARGADRFAADWAADRGIECEEYRPDWERHSKAAGHIRNARMLDEGEPDLVIAFPTEYLAVSAGTSDMVHQAWERGIPVVVMNRRP